MLSCNKKHATIELIKHIEKNIRKCQPNIQPRIENFSILYYWKISIPMIFPCHVPQIALQGWLCHQILYTQQTKRWSLDRQRKVTVPTSEHIWWKCLEVVGREMFLYSIVLKESVRKKFERSQPIWTLCRKGDWYVITFPTERKYIFIFQWFCFAYFIWSFVLFHKVSLH